MNECERFQAMIRDLVAGDLDGRELESLHAHARTCESCQRLLELHDELATLGAGIPEPDDARLDRIQKGVLRELAFAKAGARSRFGRSAALAAAMILLFVTGLVAGRFASRPGADAVGGAAPRLLAALTAEAASNRALDDAVDSRFSYSNATFRRLEGGRVALGFDVTTHLEIVEPERSALVREVLAQSFLSPSSVGARLRAMSLAAGSLDPKLRDAILLALRGDESLAVRLQALSILSAESGEPRVQEAVMDVLRDDVAVQMRLLALECLAAQRVDRQRIREAIRERERPGDEALLVRLAQYEKEL